MDKQDHTAPVPPPAAAPSVATATQALTPAPSTRPWAMVGVVLAVLALLGVFLVWQQLDRARQELARQSADVQAKVVASELHASEAKAQVQELMARLGVAEVRLSEVSLQRSQLEELMLSVSRSRDDSLVQDLESSIRMAQQHAQLTGSAQPLVSALQAAEQRITRAAQPRLNPVQRAISRDMGRVQAAKTLDVPAVVSRLDELLRQADLWPLVSAPPPAVQVSKKPAPAIASKNAGATLPPADKSAPAVAADAPSGLLGRLEQVWSSTVSRWAQAWWLGVRAQVADLVRVNRIDRPEAALLGPQEGYFLRENLKLRLLHARMALMARQTDTARADMLAARRLLDRYFDASQAQVQQGAESLSLLHRDLGQSELPRAEETLAALATAASGR